MSTREYNIDYNNPEKAATTTINMFRDQLVSFRGTSSKPDELEWGIRLYDFMLKDPVKRLKQYGNARQTATCLRSKRQVVQVLAWEIP
jgi:hypothetical protein